jgi:holo-[acyl-carrier protein] synthase
MSTVGVGVDIVDVERFGVAMHRHPAILTRLFTETERIDAHGHPERLAARFAAKEAVLKTLGVGVGAAPWRSIEIHRDDSGAPSVRLHGAAANLAANRGVDTLHVSMSHTKRTATAFVVASADEESRGAR